MAIFKRRTWIALAILLAVFGSTAAEAGESAWYLGANTGSSNYGPIIHDSETGIPVVYYPIVNSYYATGWSALGGYQINDWLGIEFSYFDMGKASELIHNDDTAIYKLKGKSLDAVFSSSTLGWGVFAKVGPTHAHLDVHHGGTSGTQTAMVDSTIVDWGAGFSYGMKNGLGFRLGFTQYHNVGENRNDYNYTGRGNVNFIYLGALYRF